MRVYFDYNATTPPTPEVVDRVAVVTRELFGNPSSVHHFGQQAKAVLDDARSSVAALINAEPSEIVFTAGGTESDNFALRGVADLDAGQRRHIVVSAIEHEAVLNTAKALARRGWRISVVPVDQSGVVQPDRVREALTSDTALVSVMLANNEIGTIQPVREIAQLAHDHGALMHTDAVQAAGKIPVDVRGLGIDLLSISAHKFNGPKGAGALYVKRGTRMQAMLTGGKHERNRRAGTENTAGLAGMGVAARFAMTKMGVEATRLGELRNRLEAGILDAVSGRQRRGGATSPQHDEHQFRPHRGREPADRPRPRGHRRVDRVCVLLGHARTVACAQGDGLPRSPHTELPSLQRWPLLDRRRGRPRSRDVASPGDQAQEPHSRRRRLDAVEPMLRGRETRTTVEQDRKEHA
jgi:cysteine desulfurase